MTPAERYARFSKSFDKLHRSEKRDALVENARRAFMDAMLAEPQRDPIAAALAVALEEAADAVGEVGDHAEVGAYIAAIRGLIPE